MHAEPGTAQATSGLETRDQRYFWPSEHASTTLTAECPQYPSQRVRTKMGDCTSGLLGDCDESHLRSTEQPRCQPAHVRYKSESQPAGYVEEGTYVTLDVQYY